MIPITSGAPTLQDVPKTWVVNPTKEEVAFEAKSVQVKLDDQGHVVAVFSEYNKVDKDMDVTLPGAFTDSAEVVLGAYNHASAMGNALPVGRGAIRVRGNMVTFDGKFFDTDSAKEHYATVKAVGDLQQWSYTYAVEKASFGEFEGQQVRFLEKLRVLEVSPVIEGSGNSTGTLIIKSRKDLPTLKEHGEHILTMFRQYIVRAKSALSERVKTSEEGQALESLLPQLRQEFDSLNEAVEKRSVEEVPIEGTDEDSVLGVVFSSMVQYDQTRSRLMRLGIANLPVLEEE